MEPEGGYTGHLRLHGRWAADPRNEAQVYGGVPDLFFSLHPA